MRESIFTSNGLKIILALAALMTSLAATPAFCDDSGSGNGDTSKDKTLVPEEEDFSQTPYTEYGEFNEDADEDAETRFLQFGRLFGVSVGLGFEQVDGNRGLLWQGGFPVFDLKMHYWFDFNWAVDLGIFSATHFYDTQSTGHIDVNVLRLGVDIKYYFDTKNLSAPISFANPYITIGGGTYTKTQTQTTAGTQPDIDVGLGISAGAGLEFPLSARKVSFELEGKIHIVNYKDTYIAPQGTSLANLTGNFYTVTGSVLFAW